MASILVIEDEASVRTLLRSMLEADGHQVMEAADGKIGLDLYRHTPTELVITDIMMPERDGLETTLLLTREFLDAKVIAITGQQGTRNFLDVAKLFGAYRTLQKPFALDALRNAVRDTLAH